MRRLMREYGVGAVAVALILVLVMGSVELVLDPGINAWLFVAFAAMVAAVISAVAAGILTASFSLKREVATN